MPSAAVTTMHRDVALLVQAFAQPVVPQLRLQFFDLHSHAQQIPYVKLKEHLAPAPLLIDNQRVEKPFPPHLTPTHTSL